MFNDRSEPKHVQARRQGATSVDPILTREGRRYDDALPHLSFPLAKAPKLLLCSE